MPASQSLSLRGTSKRYGDCVVITDVSFEAKAGELRVVVGENGAGKSTALRVMAGLIAPDSGAVVASGKALPGFSPRIAKAHGVALVAQHFSLVEGLTALENVILGEPPTGRFGGLDLGRGREKVARIVRELGTLVDLDLDRDVADLGVGERQRLEIARALYGDASTLLLDEPTAILTVGEADALYAILRRLVAEGKSVVVVTHKLAEIRRFADAVTVLRKGRVTLDEPLDRGRVDDATMERIERAILGDAAPHEPSARETTIGDEVVRVDGIQVARGLEGLSLRVKRGEIVGIAGVTGNGQDELVRVLARETIPERGTVTLPDDVAVVYEDRHREGLCLDASLLDNVLLGELAAYTRHGVLDEAALRTEATKRLASANVLSAGDRLDVDMSARSLSGGNQQKVVCARAFARVTKGAALLVLMHPTRGVDKGAATTIHEGILAARSRAAVVLVSADLNELRVLATRLYVIVRGRLTELPLDASDETIGHAMLGEGE